MSLHCPVCRHRFDLSRLRRRIDCPNCENPLASHLAAPGLTFLFLFVVVNGFIALAWWALSQSDQTGISQPVILGDWNRYPMFLIILACLISWGLFVWIFNTITHITLDLKKLPGGRPLQRISQRHYQAKEAPAK